MGTLEKVQNLKEDQCVVDVLYNDVKSHRCKECGKCVFGYEGITQLEFILRDITEKKSQAGDIERIVDLAHFMKTQSMCEDGVDCGAGFELALENYRQDFEEHAAKKGCRAGVCKRFMTYHILPDMCVGCGDCLDACDEVAITGKKRFVHIINQNVCNQCGACMEACEYEAIVRAGLEKPRTPVRPIPCKRRA